MAAHLSVAKDFIYHSSTHKITPSLPKLLTKE